MAKAPKHPRRAGAGELTRAAAFRTELRRFLVRTEMVAAEAGLTPQRYDLLLALHAAAEAGDGIRVNDLCESLQLKQTAVTELVKRAVDAGLVERLPSPDDGRASPASTLQEGRETTRGGLRGIARRSRRAQEGICKPGCQLPGGKPVASSTFSVTR